MIMIAGEDRSGRLRRDGPRTLWSQVADDLAADIEAGRLPPGSRLPGHRTLAEVYDVATITVRTAVLDLVKRGLVVVTVGRGTYVAERNA